MASLINRPPISSTPKEPFEKPCRPCEKASPAVLIRTREGFGIVTDADLRDKVLGAELSLDLPVGSVMTAPVVTIDSDRLAVESAIEMLQAGVQHLPVVERSGEILGVLSAADLVISRAPEHPRLSRQSGTHRHRHSSLRGCSGTSCVRACKAQHSGPG